jgi:hypothetical protein
MELAKASLLGKSALVTVLSHLVDSPINPDARLIVQMVPVYVFMNTYVYVYI